MKKLNVDILIIGAGPAGSSAAYDLAESGFKVLVVDCENFPRNKVCAGALSPMAYSRIRYPIDKIIRNKERFISLTFMPHPKKISSSLDLGKNSLAITSRYELDDLMLKCAISMGALFEVTPRHFAITKNDATGACLRWSTLSVNANWILAADGANSRLAKLVKEKPYNSIALETTISNELLPSEKQNSIVEFGWVKCGYAWRIMSSNYASLGIYLSKITSVKTGKQNLVDYIKKTVDSEKIDIKSAPIKTNGGRISSLSNNRILFIGEAAGLTNPITGEGISSAIYSGQKAALSIILSPEKADAIYKRSMISFCIRQRALRILSFLFYNFMPLLHRPWQRIFERDATSERWLK